MAIRQAGIRWCHRWVAHKCALKTFNRVEERLRQPFGEEVAAFEMLGPAPVDGPPVKEPILFLLENPGGDYRNGAPVEFRQFRKQPPVNHYYWTPSVKTWPSSVTDFKVNSYGPYFAYLMQVGYGQQQR